MSSQSFVRRRIVTPGRIALPLVGVLVLALATWLSPPAHARAPSPATLFAQAPTAQKQQSQPQEQPLSEERLKALVNTLQDPAKRKAFLDTLNSLIAAQKATAPKGAGSAAQTVADRVLGTVGQRLDHLSKQLLGAARLAADVPKLKAWFASQVSDPGARRRWIEALIVLVAVSFAGWLSGAMARRVIDRAYERQQKHKRATWFSRIFLGVLDLVVASLPILGFVVIVDFALAAAPVGEGVRAAGLAFVLALAAYEAVTAVALIVIAPVAGGRTPRRRLLPLSDETASYLAIWVRRFAMVGAFAYGVTNAALALGMPEAGYFTLSRAAGLIFAGFAVVFVMQNRRGVAAVLHGWLTDHGRRLAFLGRLADVWHLFVLLYLIGVYVVWALGIRGGFAYLLRASLLTVLIVLIAYGLSYGLARLIDRVLAIRAIDERRFPHLKARANRYVSIVHGVFRGIIIVVAALAVLDAWGLGLIGALSDQVGGAVIGALLHIAIVVVLTVAVWEGANALIEHYLAETDHDGHHVERSQRAKTLLPLLRTTLTIVLFVIGGITVLSELGVNVAPLLAGAGVIGLAIGFGSQKLVQDVITGIFILIENTIQVGDVATVGGHTGVVENLSIRTIRLRDLEGSVHTVPFSDVTTIINMTRDFSYKLFEVGVAYREDTDYVTRVLVDLGEEMRNDEAWSRDILEPLEVLGVERFDDSAVVIRVRFKTRPVRQWAVGREFNRRLKKRFDELGIEIPFPHRTLYFGVDRDGNAPPAHLRIEERAKPAATAETPAAAVEPAPAAGNAFSDPVLPAGDHGGENE